MLNQLLTVIVTNLPGLVVAGIGLGYALLNWDRCPRAALPVILGCIALLIAILVRPVASNIMAHFMTGESMTGESMTNEMRMYFVNGLHLVFNVIEACGVGALIYGAFCDRDLVLATLSDRPAKGV